MSLRIAVITAASPLALVALPAHAQVDDHHESAETDMVVESYSEPVIQGAGDFAEDPAETGAAYAGDDYEPEYLPEYAEEEAHGHDPARHHAAGHHAHRVIERRVIEHREPQHNAAPTTPRLAYGAAERAEWLSQCRALHTAPVQPRIVYADDDRGGNGGLVGGLIGAVVGAGAGNRIADRHRLTGTLVGTGIGGIAGAVIGSVIDSTRGRDEDIRVIDAPQEPSFDYCEAYLLNYERGYGTPAQVAYAPVTMMPMAQPRHAAHRVIEEEVEIEVDEPTPHSHTAQRTIRRRSDGDKRIPIG
jgi:hypothetical protein